MDWGTVIAWIVIAGIFAGMCFLGWKFSVSGRLSKHQRQISPEQRAELSDLERNYLRGRGDGGLGFW